LEFSDTEPEFASRQGAEDAKLPEFQFASDSWRFFGALGG
jgi:hypothetical protein